VKKLLLLTAVTALLASCGGGTPPVPEYSAIGTWNVRVLPDTVSDWRYLGYATFTSQDANGGLDGTFYSPEGVTLGRAVGNTKAGSLGLVVGLNVISGSGTFSGNLYNGRYEGVGIDIQGAKGRIEMTKR